jgi:fructose-1,6-bisphosphatase/sedoheptulose 1,7-bisphosphatase-like protein
MATVDFEKYFLQATESAAIAASRWIGKGDGKAADGAAVEAMRSVFDKVPFNGRVAIGEGERDDAPMLWIGEPLGSLQGDPLSPAIDIAVDPLECTNHVAYDMPNAMAVLAAAPRGALLHAPDCYMNKIAGKSINSLNVVVMDRPRHEILIKELRDLSVNVVLIGDGDIAAALNAADPNSDIDLLMGIGAAPEGVITATALRGLNAPFEGRLVFKNEGHRSRAEEMIDGDIERLWQRDDLCSSEDSLFIGTGVCQGRTKGVIHDGNTYSVESEIIDVANGIHKFVSGTHSA